MCCLCIIAVSVLPISSFAQTWLARYDGPANEFDKAYWIAVDDALAYSQNVVCHTFFNNI